ncbi:hypothetical protein ACOSQ2_005111 [Xanthoceras sorbifolium]
MSNKLQLLFALNKFQKKVGATQECSIGSSRVTTDSDAIEDGPVMVADFVESTPPTDSFVTSYGGVSGSSLPNSGNIMIDEESGSCLNVVDGLVGSTDTRLVHRSLIGPNKKSVLSARGLGPMAIDKA